MLYLIHEEQRQKVIEGYYGQVWKSFLLVFLGVSFLTAILAIPTIILLRTEVEIKVDAVASLTSDIEAAESKDFESKVAHIQNKIRILRQAPPSDVRGIYVDVERIVEAVGGVRIVSISVDASTKTITLTTEVRDKEVAKKLVDTLQKTRYTGAVLSYSVLSEKASFIFTQNLSYE